MTRREMYIELIIMLLLVPKVFSTNRIFSVGVINEYPSECDALDFVANNVYSLSNALIVLQTFNVSENKNLYKQASTLLDQNVIALIEGSQTNTFACALSEVSGLPLVRLHGDSRPFDQCKKAIHVSAGYQDYAHATLDIINTFHWENIALVYDETRLYEAGYFYAITRKSNLIVNLVQLSEHGKHEDSSDVVIRAMEEIENLKVEVILLYTNTKNVEGMLQKKPCPCRNSLKWIIQGKVPMNLSSYWNNIVLAFKLPYIHSSLPAVIRNNHDNAKKNLISIVYDAFQVISQAMSIEPCSSMNGSAISPKDMDVMFTCMRKVNVNGTTGPVRFDEHGKRKGIDLEILNLRNNSLIKVGTWNSTKGVEQFRNILHNKDNPSSQGNILEGRKLRAVVTEDAPFIMTKRMKGGGISYRGYCIDLLNELARMFKFTYEIYPSPDGKYGAETKNGTWNGMVGELLSKRADIAVAAFTVTERREKVIDFMVPYMYYTLEILIKKGSTDGNVGLFQFMLPFHHYVWLATLASLMIISVAVFVLNYFSPYGYKEEDGRETSLEFNFFNSMWFALACMLQQGADNTPRALSGRILAGCYWFCILIWVSTYTANLAAFFAIKSAENPINNLEDLAKSSYQVGILSSSSTSEAFRSSQYETHKMIWTRITEENTLLKDSNEGYKMVREKEEFAFINDGPTLQLLASKPPCDLTTVPGLSTTLGLSFALQQNDPAVADLTLAILRLNENGFLDQLGRVWWEFKNECSHLKKTTLSRKRIDLMSMLGVYVVLSVGLVCAFLTLIAEIVWKRRKEERMINKRPKVYSVKVQPRIEFADAVAEMK